LDEEIAMSFSTVPVRTNGDMTVNASWWNLLRTAGVALESFFGGSSYIATTLVDCANNVTSQDVGGLSFNSASVKMAIIDILVMRKTDTGGSERMGLDQYLAVYQNGAWGLVPIGAIDAGTAHGVVFSITAGGQVQYTSDSISGSNYIGKFRFRASVFGGYT
jgi:hypothetical protein